MFFKTITTFLRHLNFYSKTLFLNKSPKPLLYKGKKICRNSELNQGHRDFQSLALPTELLRHILIKLSYWSWQSKLYVLLTPFRFTPLDGSYCGIFLFNYISKLLLSLKTHTQKEYINYFIRSIRDVKDFSQNPDRQGKTLRFCPLIEVFSPIQRSFPNFQAYL